MDCSRIYYLLGAGQVLRALFGRLAGLVNAACASIPRTNNRRRPHRPMAHRLQSRVARGSNLAGK